MRARLRGDNILPNNLLNKFRVINFLLNYGPEVTKLEVKSVRLSVNIEETAVDRAIVL